MSMGQAKTGDQFDVIVIGGGPAGVTAALRAREIGATTALVERGLLGGTCTNDGCAPTRVLAKAARLMRDARQFGLYGLDAPTPTVDFAQVIERTQQVIYQLQEKKQLIAHLEDVGVTTLHNAGNAQFVDPHTVTLPNGRHLRAEKVVICAGGAARRLGFPGAEHALTHSDVWMLKKLPASVVVVGGGATGCQLASVFSAFGASVTLMDVAPRLLITEDAAVAAAVHSAFEAHGINVVTGIGGLQRIDKAGAALTLTYTQGDQPQTVTAEAVVLAVGWPGNLPPLNLAAAGVETRGNYLAVNDFLQTSVPHIYAAGDITGRMMLVQSAGYQARLAVENALIGGMLRPVEHRLVPHGGFTDPEYGSVGLTEEQASAKGDYAVSVVPFADLDRAVIDGRTDGFCKLIVDRVSRVLLGAHVVGEQAVEIVQLVSAGMASGMKIEQLADLELAYPTYAAIVGLAARELVRQLQLVQVAPEWRALNRVRGVEWERKDD
jgi:pyruvate/2-oxoglutarate dehydrogenase complex dihydrolipoamide dehydrogenase (E3) component